MRRLVTIEGKEKKENETAELGKTVKTLMYHKKLREHQLQKEDIYATLVILT